MSRTMAHRRTIALDADGVLLNYASAYAQAWKRAFGVAPAMRNANAYWPMDRWQVDRLEGEALAHFRSFFDEQFWSSIPPVFGAQEACRLLSDNGFELICVTALDARNGPARERNLRDLGFPIARVITAESGASALSPKAAIVNGLNASAFVEDYSPYLRGVSSAVHKALIERNSDGSPNVGDDLELADSRHLNLLVFAHWWIARLQSGTESR